VIIVGVVPEDAPEGYAILVKVAGPSGEECAIQNLLPAADNSFVSRPVRIDCGAGQYTVAAYYADLESSSQFTVSDNRQTDSSKRLELRMLKNVVLQAQNAVNQRLTEHVEANYAIPQDVAETYSRGVSAASLALQAIEYGDTAEAKKNMIFAIRHLGEVLDALSAERAVFDQNMEQQLEKNTDDSSDIREKHSRLTEYYYRLEELAEKNRVEKDQEFEIAASLLASSKEMMEEGAFNNASRNLDRVDELLEEIRAELFGSGEQGNRSAAAANSTRQADEGLARRLASAADRFEARALDLLNETSSSAGAKAKLQEVLSLIAGARASMEEQDYESARESLSAAYKALNDARKVMENGDDDNENSGSGKPEEESDDDSGSSTEEDDESSGEGSGGNSTGKEGQGQ